jgi:hypothetical protein
LKKSKNLVENYSSQIAENPNNRDEVQKNIGKPIMDSWPSDGKN